MSPETVKSLPLLKRTISLIKIAHEGQLYNMQPYWHHPVRVTLRAISILTEDEVYGSLFHDVVEDTSLTLDDIANFGYSPRTRTVTSALTRQETDEAYKEYIARICGTRDVGIIAIKLADLYENSNNVRFLPPEKRSRLIRYGKSIRDIHATLTAMNRLDVIDHVDAGELEGAEIERWIGEQPKFL